MRQERSLISLSWLEGTDRPTMEFKPSAQGRLSQLHSQTETYKLGRDSLEEPFYLVLHGIAWCCMVLLGQDSLEEP